MRVPVPNYYQFLMAMIESEALSEKAALDRTEVEQAAGVILAKWVKHWL